MRKLAHIETIKSIEPIIGADLIEKATILGWTIVVKKGDFKVGDKCIYIEIDSKLKDIPCFDFLRTRKFKIKIAKLKGVVSYGIVFPLSILKEDGVLEDGWTYNPNTNSIDSVMEKVLLEDDTDLTSIMGIIKYDLEDGESLQASNGFKLNPKKSKFINKLNYYKYLIKKWWKKFDKTSKNLSFPTHLVPKSDECRIQSYSQTAINNVRGKSFTETIKMDGSSLTIIKHKKDFIVCSRNMRIKESLDSKYWNPVFKYDLKKKLKDYGKNIALQMELIGEGIQGNRYNIKGYDIRLFRAYNINTKKFLLPKESYELSIKLGIPHVHIVNHNFIFDHTVDEMVEISTTLAHENNKVHEEGKVFILNDDKRFSFKVINPNYLLEKEKKEK